MRGIESRHSFDRDELRLYVHLPLIVPELEVVDSVLGIEPRASGLLGSPEIPVFIPFIFNIKVFEVFLGFDMWKHEIPKYGVFFFKKN